MDQEKTPPALETRSEEELAETPIDDSGPWVVDGLIAYGFVVLAGPPKIGKSFLAMLLAHCVSLGTPFLGFATAKAEVLYLCLEDTYKRIQRRLLQMFDEASENLRFSTFAEKIEGGLIKQLEDYASEHDDLKLVIIDTLQMVRGVGGSNMYAHDYDDISAIKQFADAYSMAVVVVTHTRKMPDSNIYNTISGSTGIMGAADEGMVLTRQNSTSNQAVLHITGRDIETVTELKIKLEGCEWVLVERVSLEEIEEREVPSCVLTVIDFMMDRAANWEGTAAQLASEAAIDDVKANVLARRMNEHREFMLKRGVRYGMRRTGSARIITLEKVEQGEVG